MLLSMKSVLQKQVSMAILKLFSTNIVFRRLFVHVEHDNDEI